MEDFQALFFLSNFVNSASLCEIGERYYHCAYLPILIQSTGSKFICTNPPLYVNEYQYEDVTDLVHRSYLNIHSPSYQVVGSLTETYDGALSTKGANAMVEVIKRVHFAPEEERIAYALGGDNIHRTVQSYYSIYPQLVRLLVGNTKIKGVSGPGQACLVITEEI